MREWLLYHLLWRWISLKARVRIENVWCWIIDEPMWQPPDYTRLVRMRSKREVQQ